MIEDAETQRYATLAASEIDRITEGNAERLVQHFAERLREVLMQRTVRAGAIPAADGAGDDWIHGVLRQRELRATLGHDTTRLPRPTG
jgi:hypothetical protein